MIRSEPPAVLLISCYELGHQPLGVAMPAGFLKRAGVPTVTMDISVEPFDEEKVRQARFIGVSVPMHTALRLGIRVLERIRRIHPQCHICCYGLYAALNAGFLLDHGADSCIGGEFEQPLTDLVQSVLRSDQSRVPGVITQGEKGKANLERLPFTIPVRDTLPGLDRYARLENNGVQRLAGYVEASRGCLHRCTHCPIPPVYDGRFFIVPADVVLEDIRRQVRAGATHITFGDPDLLNGPNHAIRIVRAMHREFPQLTFDFTAKVEHLLHRSKDLAEFAAAGCLFIITAAESLSDRVLQILAKDHTRDDLQRAIELVQRRGIALRPTWVPFTPWTSADDYAEILAFIDQNGLTRHVDPIQYAIRLLIPPGSLLAEHPEVLPYRGVLDKTALSYRWVHPDPKMDELQKKVARLVEKDVAVETEITTTFYRIRELATGQGCGSRPADSVTSRVPRLTESWFC